MDPNGGETGQWTNEKHLQFLNSMEAAFVHTMLEDNGRPLRLDRYMPDSSESTLDLKSQRPKKKSASGYNNGGRRSRLDRRTKRLSSSDHQSQPSDASQDQMLYQYNDNVLTTRQLSVQQQSYASSGSENPNPECATPQSTSLSDFSLDLNEHDSTSGSGVRSTGVKKAKQMKLNPKKWLKKLENDNEKMQALLEQSIAIRKDHLKCKEDKIMMRDANSIADPIAREYLKQRQQEIMGKRMAENSQQSQPHSSSTPNNFNYFNNLHGAS